MIVFQRGRFELREQDIRRRRMSDAFVHRSRGRKQKEGGTIARSSLAFETDAPLGHIGSV
jgi:hypothetical protein